MGPDNGVFTFVRKENITAWELTDPQFQLPDSGNTFHGRDIFAPAAAYAANGIRGSRFGPQIEDLTLIASPRLELGLNHLHGEVLFGDQFGNMLTSLGRFSQAGELSFHFEPWIVKDQFDNEELVFSRVHSKITLSDGTPLSWVDTFGDLPLGECGFLVGSSGLIEIVANRKNAGKLLRLYSGDQLTLDY